VASGKFATSLLAGGVDPDSDHPPSPSIFGENILSLIVDAWRANPTQWAKTLLLVTYDENGGFFDHVAPVTAPPGTAGEYVTASAVPDPTVIGSPAIAGRLDWVFASHADRLAVQPRRVCVIGPLRSHFCVAIPGDAIRCGSTQFERLAPRDGRGSNQRA